MSDLAISFDDVAEAYKRVTGIVKRTPVLTAFEADEMSSAKLFFKCENFQPMGAFKFRGAYNAIAQFSPAQLAGGVIAYSSGNHAQAIALSARILGTKAVIVMPSDAPQVKIDATRGYGGEIVFYDRYTEDREAIGRRLAGERGLTLIPPYDHPHVMAGQGTLAIELIEDVGSIDILVTPLGGGGLISGCAVVAKKMNPNCTVIGVEPEAGNDGQQSFRSGQIVHIDPPKTIADGAQTQHLGQYTFPVIRKFVDNIVTVSDAELIEAMKFFAGRMRMVVEPTGCLGAAAVFNKKFSVAGKKVGVVLSGGNIDLSRFASFIHAEPT
jgi:threonine dehydratase